MPSLGHQSNPFLGVELAQVHHLSAGVQVGQCRADAGDVIGRHADQSRVLVGRRRELHRAGHVARQVVVRQLDGLRTRRGARGEQHDRDVVGVGELRRRLGGAGRLDELVRRDDLFACACDDVDVVGIGDHQGSGQPVDQFAQPIGAQPVVQGCDRHPRAGRGEQQQRQHRAAGADIGDVLGAGGGDDPGPTVGKHAEFVCGQPHVAGDHCSPVRIARGSHLEQQRNAHDLSTKISRMGSSPPP